MACLLHQLSLGWGEPQKSQGDLKLTYVAEDGCELLIIILSGGGHMYVLCVWMPANLQELFPMTSIYQMRKLTYPKSHTWLFWKLEFNLRPFNST